MEFFIAFFGGLFLLIQYTIRKTSEDGIKREDNRWEAQRRPIIEAITASQEDDRAVNEMQSWPSEDLYAYLEEDLLEVFGPDYKRIVPFDNKAYRDFGHEFNPYTYRKNSTYYTREAYVTFWLTHLLYSKRGKLKSLWNVNGLNVNVGNPETNIKLCRRIEKNIAQHGTDIHLELETETFGYDSGRRHLTPSVMAREIQHRYWKGRELEAAYELNPVHPEYPFIRTSRQ